MTEITESFTMCAILCSANTACCAREYEHLTKNCCLYSVPQNIQTETQIGIYSLLPDKTNGELIVLQHLKIELIYRWFSLSPSKIERIYKCFTLSHYKTFLNLSCLSKFKFIYSNSYYRFWHVNDKYRYKLSKCKHN